MAGLDPTTLVLSAAGLACAIVLAVVAGTLTARIFFDATREPEEEV